MHKKNIPSNHELSVPKPSSSKLANFAAGAFIAINLLASSPTYSQNTKTADDSKKNNTPAWVKTNDSVKKNTLQIDSLEHQKLLTATIDAVNVLRTQNNLWTLEYAPNLQKIAQGYADYCAANNRKEGHRDKEWNGLQERINNNWYYGIAKENIYFGSGTPQEVVQDRTIDKYHTLNMLNTNSTKITVGIAKMPNGSYVYVLVVFNN